MTPPSLVRDHAGDRRTVDAVERLEHEARDRHQRAGVAGADDDIGAPFLDQVDRDAHRRIALAAQRRRRRIVHFDDLFGVDDVDARGVCAVKCALDLCAASDQQQRHRPGVAAESERRRHGDRDTVIPAHAVDGDANVHRSEALPRRKVAAGVQEDPTW